MSIYNVILLHYIAMVTNHHSLYTRNITLLKHQIIAVFLLFRHSLMCFLWRVVNFNSCIITEHQRDSQRND